MRIAFEHSLDEEPGDPDANRVRCRILAPSRPLTDIAGEAYRFLPGMAYVELAAESASEFPLHLDYPDTCRGAFPSSPAHRRLRMASPT